jgi:hypothetical protein
VRVAKIRPRNLVLATGLVAGVSVGVTGLAWASTPNSSPAHHKSLEPPRGSSGSADLVTTAPNGPASTLTVDTPSGSKTFAVTSSTTYWRGDAPAQEPDITVGAVVWVRTVPAKHRATAPDPLVAASIQIVPSSVRGYVTGAPSDPSAGASTFTITDLSGFTRTVKLETSTSYQEPKTTAPTYANVTTGTFVSVQGNVEGDGTTLDASAVRIGNPDHE